MRSRLPSWPILGGLTPVHSEATRWSDSRAEKRGGLHCGSKSCSRGAEQIRRCSIKSAIPAKAGMADFETIQSLRARRAGESSAQQPRRQVLQILVESRLEVRDQLIL